MALKSIDNDLVGASEIEDSDEIDSFLIDEKSVKAVIGRDEIDVIDHDDNFLYCPTKDQLPHVISDIFGYKIVAKVTKKEDVKFKVDMPRKIFKYKRESINFDIPVYKFQRKVSIKSKEGIEEIDILPLIQHYDRCISVGDILSRVEIKILEEWERLHGKKKPSDDYRDRVDNAFQKEYPSIKCDVKEEHRRVECKVGKVNTDYIR